MSRAAKGSHPHPLTPADLPAGDEWAHCCPDCHLPNQNRFDPYVLDALRGVGLDSPAPVAA
ncbi:hypothetical protein [Streptomyces sp. NPDC002403]